MSESKAERFRRVAQARVNRIITTIRLLANCSRTQSYSYDDEQVNQIFTTLQKELDVAKERFANGGKSIGQRFSLSEDPHKASNKHLPQISVALPDGSRLRATAYQYTCYPCINIEQISGEENTPELVCFAEFNPERGANGLLCIGTYQSNQEDTTYYEPYSVTEDTF